MQACYHYILLSSLEEAASGFYPSEKLPLISTAHAKASPFTGIAHAPFLQQGALDCPFLSHCTRSEWSQLRCTAQGMQQENRAGGWELTAGALSIRTCLTVPRHLLPAGFGQVAQS